MKLEVINRYHQDRVFVEEFIRQKYLGIFYAKITKFPSILLALTDGGQIKAACGIRTSLDGFKSERRRFTKSHVDDDHDDDHHKFKFWRR